jgi:hypothetical protein
MSPRLLVVACALSAAILTLPGCTVLNVAGAAVSVASTAVSVTAKAVGVAADVTAAGVRAATRDDDTPDNAPVDRP